MATSRKSVTMGCCNTEGLNELFTDKVSERDARKFRRRGVDRRARRLLRALERSEALRDRSSLEVGIGVGGFTVELLRRGVVRATGVDAVTPQLHHARRIADDCGVGDRLDLRQGDFTEMAADLRADVVVLDRVVCCYPDWKLLLNAAADSAQETIAMSYPRAAWYTRVWVKSGNFAMRLLRRAFRLHLHPPLAMHALLRERGFTPRVVGHHYAWELLIASRP